MLQIRTATQADRETLRGALCPEDAAELRAAGLDVSCLDGVQAKALTWRGHLVCLFGLEVPEEGPAIPWMLCTSLIERVPKLAMARVSEGVVEQWRVSVDQMANFVHRENRRALRFLRWLRFTIDPTPTGRGDAFFLFTWSRDV